MAAIALAFLALIALGLFLLGKPYVAAWFYEHFRDTEVYPPEAAEADDLDTAVDWHRYEYEMRKQT